MNAKVGIGREKGVSKNDSMCAWPALKRLILLIPLRMLLYFLFIPNEPLCSNRTHVQGFPLAYRNNLSNSN